MTERRSARPCEVSSDPREPRTAAGREYIAAVSADTWSRAGRLNWAKRAVLRVEDEARAAAERERDLAIAHDRQPYPTAHAYEAACKARDEWKRRAEAAAPREASDQRLREKAGLDAGTHEPAVDDFGNQYLARAALATEGEPT